MPFAVFRRHQRKLLAIFAILAMFGFVLADSLPRLLSGGYSGANDPVIATLYGRKVRRSDLNELGRQRNYANRFLADLDPYRFGPMPFGPLTTRSLVDALILQHEADRLGMPKGSDVGRKILRAATNDTLRTEMFEATLRRMGPEVTGEQILADIANQVRIDRVQRLLGRPVVTPLDVFDEYREQNERVSARVVGFPASEYIGKVPEPSPDQVRAYYEKYKDVLPDPTRETPGFKVPRQVRVEILSIDGTALMRQFRDKLTESELRTYYENRKSEFTVKDEFPTDLFADDPNAELTPPTVQPFSEVRTYLATSLAEEKAQAEISVRFNKIKDEVMIPDADAYYDALDEINESKKEGRKTKVTLPKPRDLATVAKQEGLQHEVSPLLAREQAENYGEVSGAEVGSTRLSGGRKFAPEFFDAKTGLFEPVELTDVLNRHFLTRKVEDHEPRVPPLDEVRSDVIVAWKLEKARPLAEQAAREFADRIRKEGGQIKEESVDGRQVVTIPPRTRTQPGFPLPNQMFQNGPPTLTDFPEVPNAGDAFRDAYFGLDSGGVAVAPNQPKNVYYVLTLKERIPATFDTLYAPTGEYLRYQQEARAEAERRREEEWMGKLRADAGLPPDWVPPDEVEKRERP